MAPGCYEFFQDKLLGNHCFGCGSENPYGLQIKSYWQADNLAVCHFTPQTYHTAAPTHFLNGGVIATIIDCHCICTAIAYAYQLQGRLIGSGKAVWYATGELSIRYLRPVNIEDTVTLEASVTAFSDKKATVTCELKSHQKICVKATVEALAVPDEWMRSG
ncbi:PaaI family thioesterase [Photobacterium sp. SDRW27]|uniref:PaaI family thioesterase n=1 Tax=Photobacterium obscurum TaxID=2829490 RepID=UPI0022435D3F|nr:PaaI family thioesterase [Photobacterium obscurum]MCW8330898.1 PaaI family thioesterase [Photobacterium obscurum]